MVKVQAIPVAADGQIDPFAWVDSATSRNQALDAEALTMAVEHLPAERRQQSIELADLAVDLRLDQPGVLAALVYREVRLGFLGAAQLRDLAGEQAYKLAFAVAQMATASLLEMSNSNLQDKEQASQVDNVKRMLVAMIDDPRVAVIKLAERVVALRHAKHYEQARRQRIAAEALTVFAPLAGRLGVGQLKWEMEDLAFRYTEEETYKDIASKLSGKRADREMQVRIIEDQLRGLLRAHGIEAQVTGRAKHIFSIVRKMRQKQVSFEQVHDVRALRVIVSRIADCYASLGLIHTTWAHIPSEFDDYVANPKENGYQSIHTAVTLPDGYTMEIQIRTEQMHADSELGVCAHWSYKDTNASAAEAAKHDGFAAKMDWLRQVMEWHEDFGGSERLSTLLQHRVDDQRIYVSTPKGHVLDLPAGSTVLDFAYRVHTDVGHACGGATVDGKPALLHQLLSTSQQVSITSRDSTEPRREWLERTLGFVRSDRARAKIAAYFRALDATAAAQVGKDFLNDALQVLGVDPASAWTTQHLTELGTDSRDVLYQMVGQGQLSLAEVMPVLAPNLVGVQRSQDVIERFEVQADNRDGLLNDITQLIIGMQLGLVGTTGKVSEDARQALLTLELRVGAWTETLQLVSHLRTLQAVTQVQVFHDSRS